MTLRNRNKGTTEDGMIKDKRKQRDKVEKVRKRLFLMIWYKTINATAVPYMSCKIVSGSDLTHDALWVQRSTE